MDNSVIVVIDVRVVIDVLVDIVVIVDKCYSGIDVIALYPSITTISTLTYI